LDEQKDMFNCNPCFYRGLALVWTLGVLCLTSGCGPANSPGPDMGEPIFYPPAPERPRLQFLTSLSGADDLGASGPSGFEEFVLGQAEQAEQITTPYGLAIFDGKLYVCDVGKRRVVVLDLENRTFGYLTEDPRLMNPVNIHIQPDGTKYVADPTAGAVFVFNRSDILDGILGKDLGIDPLDVVVRGKNCYVTDYASNQVVVLDRVSGKEVARFGQAGEGEQQFKLISDLAFGPQGHLYVTDKFKAKVFEFDDSGNLKRTLGRRGDSIDEFVRPKGIAIDREGRIWVVDAGVSVSGSLWSTEVAKIYDQEGRLLLFFGGPGNEPGTMSLPAKIVVDYDNVDLFERYAVKGATLEFLVVVTNQYGPNKISVYGFGTFPVATRPAAAGPRPAETQTPSDRVESPGSSAEPKPEPEVERAKRMEAIAQLYYRSMDSYRAGRSREARAGFVQVIDSGLIPPRMVETLQGYVKDIDSRLDREGGG